MSDNENMNTNDVSWEKTQTLGIQKNIAEPLFDALKLMLEHEKEELIKRLNNLKRMGVISVNTAEMNKKLQEMKFTK
jgi:hypothetical protein